jgi:small subunit ribosomal protein S16
VESKKKPKTGNYQELLGTYNARGKDAELKSDRIKYWISKGATVSDTVHNMLVSQKIIDAKKINVLPRKSPPKKEGEAPKETASAAETQAPVNTEVAPEPAAQ